jgi:hypothetical protein
LHHFGLYRRLAVDLGLQKARVALDFDQIEIWPWPLLEAVMASQVLLSCWPGRAALISTDLTVHDEMLIDRESMAYWGR